MSFINNLSPLLFVIGVALLAIIGVIILASIAFRTVVTTNSVHVVQSGSTTTSYGRGQPAGNTYYRWPSWLPVIGVRVTILPVSIFSRKLVDYDAYDVDRVPFTIDVVGFFRIKDTNAAAERVKSFDELEDQLEPILQGAARTILATSDINDILGKRDVFSEKFTNEVTKDLESWGVEPVKSIELMDIRDAKGSQVIQQIMAKKKSFIEMESRTAVAQNQQLAQTAEISANQTVAMNQQVADEIVGQRTAEKNKNVGIAQQKAEQAVQEEAKATMTAMMAVSNVKEVRAAEIERDKAIVQAEQSAKVAAKTAEGTKAKVTLESEGQLEATRNKATGIQLEGEANAKAQELLLLAPVNSQITLAKEIGNNEGYQTYLVKVKTVEANRDVGMAQAEALKAADVKVITTANDPASGLSLVSLGTGLRAVIDAFKEEKAA